MIAAPLKESARYESLVPGLAKAFAWLREHAASPPEDGRYEIDGDRVFAIVMQYETRPRVEKIHEGHYKYLDVQFLADGGPEALYYSPAELAPVAEDYDPSRDFIKYDPTVAESLVVLHKGDFAVFFPEDAHMPGVAHGEPARVKKIVVKVRVA